jgi:hypothetical protein
MPSYEFKNKETGEIIEKQMKIAERDQFLQDNPLYEPYHSSVAAVGDPVRLGVRKVDKGFREVLQKIHERSPGSRLNTIADI